MANLTGSSVPSAGPVAGAMTTTLETADVRVTQPRRAVIELIAVRGDGHFTANDLVTEARQRRIRIGRATVFRTIDLLVATGAIERLDLPDGEHAYVACEPSHHHHIVCTDCGRSVDVADGDLREVVGSIERASGFRIEGHRLELYGRCPDCRPTSTLDA